MTLPIAPSFCARCGNPVTAGAHYCTVCGDDVSGAQASLATEQFTAVWAAKAEPAVALQRGSRRLEKAWEPTLQRPLAS